MNKMTTALWQDWSGDSIEYIVLNETLERICADSAIIRKDAENPFAARYEIVCDPEWRVRHVSVSLVGDDRGIELSSDGNGNWSDESGARDEFRGAIDIDISATPFTNTLPIRRLKLGTEQSADILTVYIHLPELGITPTRSAIPALRPADCTGSSRSTVILQEISRSIPTDSS